MTSKADVGETASEDVATTSAKAEEAVQFRPRGDLAKLAPIHRSPLLASQVKDKPKLRTVALRTHRYSNVDSTKFRCHRPDISNVGTLIRESASKLERKQSKKSEAKQAAAKPKKRAKSVGNPAAPLAKRRRKSSEPVLKSASGIESTEGHVEKTKDDSDPNRPMTSSTVASLSLLSGELDSTEIAQSVPLHIDSLQPDLGCDAVFFPFQLQAFGGAYEAAERDVLEIDSFFADIAADFEPLSDLDSSVGGFEVASESEFNQA
ncbi:MAG: hypothetical protein MHM6MM_006046 [Cercozoa sp. M6MM]